MAEKKENRVTIANYLALIGLAAIGFISFLGFMFKSDDGTPGVPILLAVAIILGLSLFLYMSIKAKTADNNPGKWKIVEIIALVCYLAVAVCSAFPFLNFFGVVANKEELQTMALSEIRNIQEIYKDYDSQRITALNNAKERLINYDSQTQSDHTIDTYKKKHVKDVNKWYEDAVEITSFSDPSLEQMEEGIENWKMFELAGIANQLHDKCVNVKNEIEFFIESYKNNDELIPKFEVSPYKYTGLVEFNIKDGQNPQFYYALHSGGGSSPLGWILLVALHLIILLSYFSARRANYLPSTTKTSTTGIDL